MIILERAPRYRSPKTATTASWFTVANGKWAWAGAPPRSNQRFVTC